MKKLRAIAIKNPKLIKIRNNLRKIWTQALIEQQEKMMADKCSAKLYDDEIKKMLQNLPPDGIDIFSFTLDNLFLKLIFKKLEKSICMCGNCWKMDQNMVFIPKIQKWWCFNCYITAKYFPKKLHPAILYDDWKAKLRSILPKRNSTP